MHKTTGVSIISLLRVYAEMVYTPLGSHSDTLQVETVHLEGVRVLIYRPQNKDSAQEPHLMPCIVYFHGGGWAYFSTGSYDVVTAQLSERTAAVVVSVEYRRAPEHPYPIPFDDCLKATRNILHHGENYRIDVSRVAVAGDGTGGNLAAAVALRLGEEDPNFTPHLKLQILIQPALQALTFNTPSYRENAYYSLIGRRQMIRSWCHYLGIEPSSHVMSSMERGRHVCPSVRRMLYSLYMAEAESVGKLSSTEITTVIGNTSVISTGASSKNPDLDEPDYDPDVSLAGSGVEVRIQDSYFSPLMVDSMPHSPRTLILVGDKDVVRDDGLLYSRKLTLAGVNVTLLRLPARGQGHMAPLLPPGPWSGWFTFSGSASAWEHVYSFVRENL